MKKRRKSFGADAPEVVTIGEFPITKTGITLNSGRFTDSHASYASKTKYDPTGKLNWLLYVRQSSVVQIVGLSCVRLVTGLYLLALQVGGSKLCRPARAKVSKVREAVMVMKEEVGGDRGGLLTPNLVNTLDKWGSVVRI